VHVGHGVLADGNVGLDSLGSPVVVGVDGTSVVSDLVMEDGADVFVMAGGLDSGVVVDTGDVRPFLPHVGGVSVLVEHELTVSHGDVVFASVVLLEVDGNFVGLEVGTASGEPHNSVFVAVVSVLDGRSESVHSGVHRLVTVSNNLDGVTVSVSPRADESSGVTVFVESSLGVLDGMHVSVEATTDDFNPGVVVASSGHHQFVIVVASVSGDTSSLAHGDHVHLGLVVVTRPDVDFTSGGVHAVLVCEVSVDHVMSVLGEAHVCSSEGSLSLSVAGPVSGGGEEAHSHVGFLGNLFVLVASADFLDVDVLFLVVSVNLDVIIENSELVATTSADVEFKLDCITSFHLVENRFGGSV